MTRFPKPCLDCGQLTTGGNRCDDHQNLVRQLHEIKRANTKKLTGQYSGSYRARAAQIRDTAISCWICGEGARVNDPWQADHVQPGENGDVAELRAAHGSCNRRRSNNA